MITTIKKRKVILVQVTLFGYQGYKPFEIKLPPNAIKVTGIMVTARQVFGG